MMDDDTQIRGGRGPTTDLTYPLSDVLYPLNNEEEGHRPAENDLARLIDQLPAVWKIQSRSEPRGLTDCLEAIPKQWVISGTSELPLRHSDHHLVDFSALEPTWSSWPHFARPIHTETLSIAKAELTVALSAHSMAQNASSAPGSKIPNLLSDEVTASVAQAAPRSTNPHLIVAGGSKTKVTDTIGRIDANSASLIAMLSSLQWVNVIDRAPVTGASAPALERLPSNPKHVVSVQHTAAQANNTLTVVQNLGTYVAIQAPDGAANIASMARAPSLLQGLGSPWSISSHDTAAFSAENATELVSVVLSIPSRAILDGLETADPAASYLGVKLGTAIPTPSTASTAVVADGLMSSGSDLNTGMMLSVAYGATEVAANLTSLGTRPQLDGTLRDMVVANQTVSTVLANQAVLSAAGAQVSILDSAENVVSAFNQLEPLCGPGGIVETIGLIDHGTPTLTMSVAQLGQDRDVLTKIATPYQVEIADSATNIELDLVFANSVLVANKTEIVSIDACGGTIAMFQDQAIAFAAVLAKLVDDTLVVIGVDVAHLSAVLAARPTDVFVVDTAADIQADLTSGNSVLVSNNGQISGIEAGGTVTINQDQAIASAAVLTKLIDGSIVVSRVDVAHLSEIANLGLPQLSIDIVDTAAAIQADLISGNSGLLANNSEIANIDAENGSITLNQAQVFASVGVLAKLTDGSIVVTGVDVAHLSQMASLGLSHISLDIVDTAADILADLASGNSSLRAASVDIGSVSVISATIADVANIVANIGSLSLAGVSVVDTAAAIQADLASGNAVLVANNGEIVSVDAEDGTIAVNQTEAFASAEVLTKLTDGGIIVSGVDIDHLSEVASLGLPHISIDVADTAANIQADLASANSMLVANSGGIASVVANGGGIVSLTQAEILRAGVDDGAGSVLSKLAGDTLLVTDVDVAHINTVLGLGAAPANIAVADTPANLQADLASGSSAMVANSGSISSIDAEGGTITLSEGQVLAGNLASVLPKLIDDEIVVTGVDLAHVADVAGLDLPRTSIVVADTAENLLNPANAGAEALATTLKLAGPDVVDATGAEELLSNNKFDLDQMLTINDTASNLLDGVLAEDINASPHKPYVEVTLSDPETVDARTAQELVSLNGFADPLHRLTIADSSSHLLDPANYQAEIDASSVTLAGDEAVSLEVVKSLTAVPHFSIGANVLHLASNDYGDAATLKAIADFGSGFDPNGHTITMTQDVTLLTPIEYGNLQSDDVVQNNHVLTWLPTGVTAGGSRGTATISGIGEPGGTMNVFDSSGSLLSTTSSHTAEFTASGTDGRAVVLTESVSGWSDSAPIIVLEQSVIVNTAAAVGATLARAGVVQIGTSGAYLNLYDSGSVPDSLSNPALVYDAAHHTLSLDIPGYATTVLVTLNASASPAHLDASEIFIKHYNT